MPKKIFIGKVISDKMDKTVVVQVDKERMHPVYKKSVIRRKKYAAHDETNQYREGMRVKIQESKPYSKTKCWEVIGAEDRK
jgi:small subunit ribosomal protein S17